MNSRRWKRPLLIAGAVLPAVLVGVGSVRLDWWEPRPVRAERAFVFAEDFESVATFGDLFPADRSRWDGRQLVPEQNALELTAERAHSGRHALKCRAVPTRGGTTSKADLERGGLRFVKGDHVWFEGWFFLVGGSDAASVFLWDLEASRKHLSPGRRLYLQTGDVLASDLGKWLFAPKFRQPWDHGIPFPKDRWVRLRVHLLLSETSGGAMEVWQDESKIIDAHGQTLPTAKAIYDRLQIGLTANGNPQNEHTLYVDDLLLSNRPLP